MKAIRTRYVGPSNTKGSRIIASDADGNKVTISYPHSLTSDDAHELAAYALMRKMQWSNELVSGGFGSDNFWVMLPRVDKTVPPVFETYFDARPEYAGKGLA